MDNNTDNNKNNIDNNTDINNKNTEINNVGNKNEIESSITNNTNTSNTIDNNSSGYVSLEKEYIAANKLKENIESLSHEFNIQRNGYTTPNPMSKRQRKKKLKEEKWEATAEERRLKRIEKRKEIKARRKMEKKMGTIYIIIIIKYK